MKKMRSLIAILILSVAIGVGGLPQAYGEEIEIDDIKDPETVEVEMMDEEVDEETLAIIESIPEIEALAGTYEPLLLGGWNFSIARLSDGTWWSWGANEFGQLGHGDKENRIYPVRIKTELDTKKIKWAQAQDESVFLVTSDNELYQWGQNTVGNGHSSTPRVLRSGITDAGHTWLTRNANRHDAVAMVRNGQVYVTGSGYMRQFGRGLTGFGSAELGTTSYTRSVSTALKFPVLTSAVHETIPGTSHKRVKSGTPLTNVKQVAGVVGGFGFMAVTNTNEIYSWGTGIGTLATKNNHASMKLIGNVVDLKVHSSSNVAFALNDKGELWSWRGAQGEASMIRSGVKATDVTRNNLLVLLKNGDLYAQGDPTYGAILGGNPNTLTKIQSGVTTIASGERHSLWMKSGGKIHGAGWNAYRQLSVAQDGAKEKFTKLSGISGANGIFASEQTSYAYKGYDLYSWGHRVGELGSSVRVPSLSKTFHAKINNVTGSRTSIYKLMGINLSSGDHVSFGDNWHHRLGYQSSTYNTFWGISHSDNANVYVSNVANGKTYVKPKNPNLTPANAKLVDVAQGLYGGAGIDSQGRLLAWGMSRAWGFAENDMFLWGSEGVQEKSTGGYIQVPVNDTFKKVAGGHGAFLAITKNGEVYSWGDSDPAVLGRDRKDHSIAKIPELKDIVDVAIGTYTGLALDSKGDIFAWGANGSGQVGDGTVNTRNKPVNITDSIDEKFVFADVGTTSSYAITDKGELYAWGDNRYGQLGLGDRFSRTGPRKVEGLPGKVKSVSNGKEHTLILIENGDVYAAGGDSNGQLGMGPATDMIKTETEIPFPDYITITNKDNSEYVQSDLITIAGNITSVVDGHRLELTYDVKGSAGTLDSGTIGTYTSSRTPVNFSKTIGLGPKYAPGGYTITVKVSNASTKFDNESAVNFALVDREPPSAPKIVLDESWSNKDVLVSITPGSDKLSSVKTYYSIDGEEIEYSKPFSVSKDGDHKINAYTIDAAMNQSTIVSANARVDKTAPSIHVSVKDLSITHEFVDIDVVVSDATSGVSKWVHKNSGYESTANGKVTIKDNGLQEFIVYDKAGNESSATIKIDNIDISLSINVPKTITKEIILSDKEAMVEITPIKVNDWRRTPVPWRMSVKASNLSNGKHSLINGSMLLGNNVIDGMGATFTNSNNKRGESDWNLGNMSILFDLSQTTRSAYKSTITWDIVQAP